jgi:carbonic anhydrase
MSQVRRAALAALIVVIASSTFAADHATSKSALWHSLMAGNHRYIDGRISYNHLRAQRAAVAPSQHPRVSILSCADSRVSPELVFDKSVGELFVVRVAGNVPDPFGIASLEFAVANGYTEMIVVIGHESCGAVKAAMDEKNPGTPSLDALVAQIRESFTTDTNRDSKDAAALQHAVELNARKAASDLVAQSAMIRKAVEEGKVEIVAASYDLDTGVITRLD